MKANFKKYKIALSIFAFVVCIMTTSTDAFAKTFAQTFESKTLAESVVYSFNRDHKKNYTLNTEVTDEIKNLRLDANIVISWFDEKIDVISLKGIEQFNLKAAIFYDNKNILNKDQEQKIFNTIKNKNIDFLTLDGYFETIPQLNNPKALKYLSMFSDNLSIIPKFLEDYTNLETLILSKDMQQQEVSSRIDADLGKLINLKFLRLTDFNMKITDAIFGLEKLERLELYRLKQLRSIPKEVEKAKNLKKIVIESYLETPPDGKYGLLSIHPNIGKLDLTTLKISNAWNLKSIPKEMFNNKNLEYLTLQSLFIKYLPKEITGLKKLKTAEINTLQNLEKIDKATIEFLRPLEYGYINENYAFDSIETSVDKKQSTQFFKSSGLIFDILSNDSKAKFTVKINDKDISTSKYKLTKTGITIPTNTLKIGIKDSEVNYIDIIPSSKKNNGENLYHGSVHTIFVHAKQKNPPKYKSFKKGHTTYYQKLVGNKYITTKSVYKKGSTSTTQHYKVIKGHNKLTKKETYVKYKKKNVRTYYHAISYHSNGKVKVDTKLYKDKKTNKYTKKYKTTYRSNGKKSKYIKFAYKKGKATKRTEYVYNKLGKTRSDKHGKAYRYITKYNKKGKATRTDRKQYNKKGKLSKNKKVKKRTSF